MDQGEPPRDDGGMGSVLVEVCVDSVAGVRAALAGGADRIELCSALELGGLTPPSGLVGAARAATALPIFAMVRVRAGDFVVDRADLSWMAAEIGELVRGGVDGLVFGALTPDGAVDRDATAMLCAAAQGLPVTFHRAFDHLRDQAAGLEVLVELGVPRVLTSGAAGSASDGVARLSELVAQGGRRIAVMAGAGLRSSNVSQLVAATGVREVHLSAARVFAGPGRHANDACSFAPPGRGEFERRETSADEVRAVVRALAAPR